MVTTATLARTNNGTQLHSHCYVSLFNVPTRALARVARRSHAFPNHLFVVLAASVLHLVSCSHTGEAFRARAHARVRDAQHAS